MGGKLFAIDRHLCLAKPSIMGSVKDIGHFVGTVIIPVAIQELFDGFWIREEALKAGNYG